MNVREVGQEQTAVAECARVESQRRRQPAIATMKTTRTTARMVSILLCQRRDE